MEFDELFVNSQQLLDPLPKEELSLLILKAQNGDKEALDKVIYHNLRLVFFELKTKFYGVSYDKKELAQIGAIGLLNAINTFDVYKNTKFSSYAVTCVDNSIINFLKKTQKEIPYTSLEDEIFTFKNGKSKTYEDIISDDIDVALDYEELEMKQALNLIVDKLPEKDRNIVKLYYGFFGFEYSQKEIAKMLHVTPQCISSALARNLDKITLELKKMGYIEKVTPKLTRYRKGK